MPIKVCTKVWINFYRWMFYNLCLHCYKYNVTAVSYVPIFVCVYNCLCLCLFSCVYLWMYYECSKSCRYEFMARHIIPQTPLCRRLSTQTMTRRLATDNQRLKSLHLTTPRLGFRYGQPFSKLYIAMLARTRWNEIDNRMFVWVEHWKIRLFI